MSGWVVCCDFDGTICLPDSTDFLLSRFAPPEWRDLEAAVWAGKLTEREMYERQVSLLRVTWEIARDAVIEGVRLRDGFSEFIAWCRDRNLPFVILSSGLKPLINELLLRSGLSNIPVEAHDVLIDQDRWKLLFHRGPRLEEHCSHCKCAFLEAQHAAGRKVTYIGDSFTDLCPARRADILFATYRLAEECEKNGRPYYSYSTFHDIGRTLESILPPIKQESPL